MWVPRPGLSGGAALTLGAACVVGAALLVHAPAIVWLVGAASIAAAVGYTAGPAPLGYLGLGDILVLAFFGLVAVGGTYGLQVGAVPPRVWLAGVAIGALATAILVVNNLRDRHSDVRAGKRTLAVRFGAGFARLEYTALVVTAYAIAAGLAVSGEGAWWWTMLSAPLAAAGIRDVWRLEGRDLNSLLGATARTELAFAASLWLGVAL